MQTPDPPDPPARRCQGAAWRRTVSRKPRATAALTAPARDAIDVLQAGTSAKPANTDTKVRIDRRIAPFRHSDSGSGHPALTVKL